MFLIKPQLIMTQHSAFKRPCDLFRTDGVKLGSAAELITEQQPPDNDSAFVIINGGLSLLQTKCLLGSS